MLRESLDHLLVPDPVLKHLRGQLDKVSLNLSASKLREVGFGQQVVHDVAEFVEERPHISVAHRPYFAFSRLREVDDHSSNWSLKLAVYVRP